MYVFDLQDGRIEFLSTVITELRLRSVAGQPFQAVEIGGSVNAPGQFPLEPGMRISDLVRAGAGLAQSAYTRRAELTRYSVDGGVRRASIIDVDLEAALAGDETSNQVLQPFDYLNIREMSQWGEGEFIILVGEVKFPGTYPIKRGERLSSLVARAGGLTPLAYPRGSVFTREELKQREREQLRELAARVESDLASLALSDPGQAEAIGTGQTAPFLPEDGVALGWSSTSRASSPASRKRTSLPAVGTSCGSRSSRSP